MKRLRIAVLVVVQLLAVGCFVGWAARVTWQSVHRTELPPAHNEPVLVGPQYDNPLVVSDEQLKSVLTRLLPRFRDRRTPVSTLDHALRFWGIESKFDDPSALSGEEMRRFLIDHQAFVQATNPDVQPLLIDDDSGVRFRTFEGTNSSSHVDHTLACLAEVGTPLDFEVITPMRVTSLRAVLEQSLRDFSLNQTEYEWSAMVYAMYLEPPVKWTTRERQQMDFDRITRRIMRQRLPQGVCRANHRMYALAAILRIDEMNPLLSAAGREKVVTYLQEITRLLVANQHPDGFWESDWSQANTTTSGPPNQVLADRLLVTGHVLEWWAIAPPELLPPRETVVRAGQWTVNAIENLDEAQIIRRYGPLSHAGRALALWRGRFPHEVAIGHE